MLVKLPKARANPTGPGNRLYAEPSPSPGERSIQQDNTSAACYTSAHYLAHMKEAQAVTAPRTGVRPYLNLNDYVPTEVLDAITEVVPVF
jgi:hypothetical protein